MDTPFITGEQKGEGVSCTRPTPRKENSLPGNSQKRSAAFTEDSTSAVGANIAAVNPHPDQHQTGEEKDGPGLAGQAYHGGDRDGDMDVNAVQTLAGTHAAETFWKR